jgi:Tfp pilus assembly protein PilF
MGLFCLNHGQYEESEKYYTEALKISRYDSNSLFNRGMAKARQKKMTEACEDWEKAKKFGNKDVVSLLEANCH